MKLVFSDLEVVPGMRTPRYITSKHGLHKWALTVTRRLKRDTEPSRAVTRHAADRCSSEPLTRPHGSTVHPREPTSQMRICFRSSHGVHTSSSRWSLALLRGDLGTTDP
jgi:hypothetical protein